MNISQTKLLKPLSVHEYTHQMQTYCEREKKSWDGTFNHLMMEGLDYWLVDDEGDR